ncbi:MAG: nicotinate-nucleotide adenylyltransferase [Planctomycetota bacterium]
MRIGIFGGSFDPIHQGHLIIAEQCREKADLDQVWFVPCAMNPHKRDGAQGTDRQRKEMIELALAGHEPFRISTVELDRGGVSYTVDTLTTFSQTYPDDDLFLLMGDDSLESFERWKEPETICQLATPLIVNRPGSGEVDLSVLEPFIQGADFDQLKTSQVECPRIEISSTEIRRRIAAGESVRFMLPRSVERYIQTQRLYQTQTSKN